MQAIWPGQSNHLCWNCCHSFDGIPVFLPRIRTSNSHSISLYGNFCSFNCAKRYYFNSCKESRKADSVHLITLMAFLLSHRPTYCENPFIKHKGTCRCLEKFHGIRMANPKESLSCFGGNLSIREYRKDFMVIKGMQFIDVFFSPQETTNFGSITSTIERRRWTYCFNEKESEDTKVKNKTEKDIGKPIVHKRTLKFKRFFH